MGAEPAPLDQRLRAARGALSSDPGGLCFAADFGEFGDIVGKLVHGIPVGEVVVALCVRGAATLFRDKLHHFALEETVVRVEQGATEDAHDVWLPASSFEEVVEIAVDFGSWLFGIFSGGETNGKEG